MRCYCVIGLVLTMIVSGTGFRLLMNMQHGYNQTCLAETRLAVLDALSQSVYSDWIPPNEFGIQKVAFQRFDPDAVVLEKSSLSGELRSIFPELTKSALDSDSDIPF